MEESLGARVLILGACVAGIWGAYVYQGVLQETVSTKKFGPDGLRFKQLTFLNLTQHVLCLFWCLLMSLWSPTSKSQAPLSTYWKASISNSFGPACGVLALRYVSYPAQVLVKSSKMIPVMLMGAMVFGVRYTAREYVCSFLVALGVASFALFKSSSKKISKVASPNAPYGYGLILVNLGLDGYTNANQDSIKARYPKTSGWQLMLGMNFWGSIYMALFMFGWSKGGGYEAIQFCREYPEAAWDILMFCICGAVGQNFIFLTISRFGALTTTTITTTRKFVSILVSALWTGNALTGQQWVGVAMVFSGLTYQILLKWQKARLKSKPKSNFALQPQPQSKPQIKSHPEEKTL